MINKKQLKKIFNWENLVLKMAKIYFFKVLLLEPKCQNK